MKRASKIVGTIAMWAALSGVASAGWWGAGDDYDATESHPLRLIAYVVHPVGFVAEWIVARPLHYVVSRPGLDAFFGHRVHSDEASS